MNIGAVSDTHNSLYEVTPVDILLHAGDLTIYGSRNELIKAIERMLDQPADERVAIAGNHDRHIELFNEDARKLFKEAGIHYLQDEEVTVKGLRIYGSPYTLEFSEYSFMMPRAVGEAEKRWALIPEGIDILLTHSPPWGRFDVPFGSNNRVGCSALMRELFRVKPRVHVFGHIHSPGDVVGVDGIRYINAAMTSTATGSYKLAYDPVLFELEPNGIQER